MKGAAEPVHQGTVRQNRNGNGPDRVYADQVELSDSIFLCSWSDHDNRQRSKSLADEGYEGQREVGSQPRVFRFF